METISAGSSYTARVRMSRLDDGGWDVAWVLGAMMLPPLPYLVIPMLLPASGGGEEPSTLATAVWVSLAVLASIGGLAWWFMLAARWPRLDGARWFHALTRIRLDASGIELEGLAPMPWRAVRSVARESADGDSVIIDTVPFKRIRVHLPVDEALPVFGRFMRTQAQREAPPRRVARLPASDKALFHGPDAGIARREASPATPEELKQLQPLARGQTAGWFLPVLEAFVLVPVLATMALLAELAIGRWGMHGDWDQPGMMRLTLWIAAAVFVLWAVLRRWGEQAGARHRHWRSVLANGEVELECHRLEQATVLWAPLPLGEDEPEPVNPTRGIAWIVARTAGQRWLALRHDQAGLPSHAAHGAAWLSFSGDQLAPRQCLALAFAPRTHLRIGTRCSGDRVPTQVAAGVMPRAEAEQLERAANVDGVVPPGRYGLVDGSDVPWLEGLLRRTAAADSR